MNFKVILEDGITTDGVTTFKTAQRGTIEITDHDIVFIPIKLNAGNTSIRTYPRKDIISIEKGPLTHLNIYLTDNRLIRLNTLNKSGIIAVLSEKK